MTSPQTYDLIIVGGGINGAGIARDAAGRGLKVLLAEMGDLASATSSASSKMIHGGLRYLETFQFRLVGEALAEREVLLKIAPHLVRPMRFILPHAAAMRAQLKMRAGLWLYDHLGGRSTFPKSGKLKLSEGREGQPLRAEYSEGFFYSDAVAHDARLVVLNAMDAKARGADVRTHTKVEALWAEDGHWKVRLSAATHAHHDVVAGKVLVNAAGPWVADVLKMAKPTQAPAGARMVKGSHIVVPRLYEGDWAYLCQNTDGRVVFFWPYERDFTLIGTTDIPYNGDPAHAACSDEEVEYLLRVASLYFKHPPVSLSVVQKFAGVRALYDDGNAKAKDVSRDYVLQYENAFLPAPMLSIFGGKLTTYRKLSEAVLAKLTPHFPEMKGAWTASALLPGGDIGGSFEDFFEAVRQKYPWLEWHLARRLCRQYGTRIEEILRGAQSPAGLGEHILPDLYAAEVDYLCQQEFACRADDILWRRTRLGLRMGRAEFERLDEWLRSR